MDHLEFFRLLNGPPRVFSTNLALAQRAAARNRDGLLHGWAPSRMGTADLEQTATRNARTMHLHSEGISKVDGALQKWEQFVPT